MRLGLKIESFRNCYNLVVDDYQLKQLELTKRIEEGFKSGKKVSTVVEPVSDYVNDNRICLTSVVFVPHDLERVIIDKVINPLSKTDPLQYFYIPDSFHITINNVRTISEPPLFSSLDIEKAKEVFKKVVPKYKKFTLEVKRLFELPTSIAISAFSERILEYLVFELRNELEEAGVPDNKKYASDSTVIASTTISRFTDTPNSQFYSKVKTLKDTVIGTFEVQKISLITTNAVCYPKKTKIIEEYHLS